MAYNSPNPIPFSEPPYIRGLPSPYITPAHRRFQQACRKFATENLIQHALEWEREGTVPEHVFHTFCKHNMLLPNMPAPLPVDWLKRLGINDILGVKVEDWDYIYTGIYCDEVCYENCLTIYNRKVIDWLFANRWPGLVSVALVAP
jgi:acyl-CoA dehydrogenase